MNIAGLVLTLLCCLLSFVVGAVVGISFATNNCVKTLIKKGYKIIPPKEETHAE